MDLLKELVQTQLLLEVFLYFFSGPLSKTLLYYWLMSACPASCPRTLASNLRDSLNLIQNLVRERIKEIFAKMIMMTKTKMMMMMVITRTMLW